MNSIQPPLHTVADVLIAMAILAAIFTLTLVAKIILLPGPPDPMTRRPE